MGGNQDPSSKEFTPGSFLILGTPHPTPQVCISFSSQCVLLLHHLLFLAAFCPPQYPRAKQGNELFQHIVSCLEIIYVSGKLLFSLIRMGANPAAGELTHHCFCSQARVSMGGWWSSFPRQGISRRSGVPRHQVGQVRWSVRTRASAGL